MKAKTLSQISVSRIIKGVALGSTLTAAMVAANSASAYGNLAGIACWGPPAGAYVNKHQVYNQLGKPDCEVIDQTGRRVAHAIYFNANMCIAVKATPQCEPNMANWKESMRVYRGQPVYHMTQY